MAFSTYITDHRLLGLWPREDGAVAIGPLLPQRRLGKRRLLVVFAVASAGLLIQAIGEWWGRAGEPNGAVVLLVLGVVVIFAPCAALLFAEAGDERERRAAIVILALFLLLSAHLENPFLFDGFDELLHETTLWHLSAGLGLGAPNSLLPVSPRYPGLELFTIGIRSASGLPVLLAEFVAVFVARVILLLGIYTVVRRLVASPRAGGIGVLAYAMSPQFYAFNTAYSYQTLALGLGVGAGALLLFAIDRPEPSIDRRVVLIDLVLVTLAVTHHLVSWLALFALDAIALASARSLTRPAVRVLRHVALVATGATVLWTALNARLLISYLKPILLAAIDGMLHLLTHLGSHRAPFTSGSGIPTPRWEELLIVASVLLTFAPIVLGTLAIRRGAGLRGGFVRRVAPPLALTYPLAVATSLSANSAEVGQRATSFIFLPIAVVATVWIASPRCRLSTVVLTGAATVCFAGALLYGSGPSWTEVPGPYVPSSDERSIDATSIAAARWAAANLPVGARIAADRDNAALMAALGHLSPVTALTGGGANVGPLYFDPVFGNYERSLIKQGRIDYLLVDRRLLEGPPAFGFYFEPGETQGPERLTAAELDKFATVPGITAVYDSGPIVIYSLSGLGLSPKPVSSVAPAAADAPGANLGLVAFALVIALLCLRRRRGSLSSERALELCLAGVVTLVAIGLLVALGVPGDLVESAAIAALVGVALLGGSSPPRPRPGLSPRDWALGTLGALVLIGALVFDATSGASEFTSPVALGVASGRSGQVATVALDGLPATSARVELVQGSRDLWSSRVPPGGELRLPHETGATSLLLLEGTRTLREVGP